MYSSAFCAEFQDRGEGGESRKPLPFRQWGVAVMKPCTTFLPVHVCVINYPYLPHGPPQHRHRHRHPEYTYLISQRIHEINSTYDLRRPRTVRFLNLNPNSPTLRSLRPETSSTRTSKQIASHHMNLTHILPPKDPPRLVRLPGPAADENNDDDDRTFCTAYCLLKCKEKNINLFLLSQMNTILVSLKIKCKETRIRIRRRRRKKFVSQHNDQHNYKQSTYNDELQVKKVLIAT